MCKFVLKALFIPTKPDEEWKESTEGDHVPLIICSQTLKGPLTERQEVELESNMLAAFKTVEIGDKFVTLTPQYFYQFDLRTDGDFMKLFKAQQTMCIEIRVFNYKSVLLFSIGGMWDNIDKSWIYEPFSKPTEIWK